MVQSRRFLRVARLIHRVIAFPVVDLLFPTDCFGCSRPLGPMQHLGACAACWTGLAPVAARACVSCGLPLPGGTDLLGSADSRCAACVIRPIPLDAVRAAVLYDSLARRFLLRGKFGSRPELFPVLGDQLVRGLVAGRFATGCTAVVPVPSHPWSLLRRGFNPALELARPVARATGLPLHSGVLRRRWRRAAPAKRARAAHRATAVRDAFRARGDLRGERILLVDDVLTTGATLAACARALRQAGAAEVRGAVWARTPIRSTGTAFREVRADEAEPIGDGRP